MVIICLTIRIFPNRVFYGIKEILFLLFLPFLRPKGTKCGVLSLRVWRCNAICGTLKNLRHLRHLREIINFLCKINQLSKTFRIFAVGNKCEVRRHLGNEQARCSRFALTLTP